MLYDFKALTNDKPIEREFLPIEQGEEGTPLVLIPASPGEKEWYTYKSDYAYTIPVTFKHGITTTRINYKNIYRLSKKQPYDELYYYYGSGNKWKDDINKIELIVINKSPYTIFSESFGYTDEKYERTNLSSDSYKITMFNIEPAWYASFQLSINSINQKIEDFFNESQKIERSDFGYTTSKLGSLSKYSKAQLRIIRNTVYALHGYNFKSKDLQDLFNTISWYKSNPNYSDNLLTEKQKEFIELIRQEEAKRK